MWQKILMTPVGNVDRLTNAHYAIYKVYVLLFITELGSSIIRKL